MGQSSTAHTGLSAVWGTGDATKKSGHCTCILPFTLSSSNREAFLEQGQFPSVFVQHIVEQGLPMLYKQWHTVSYRWLVVQLPTGKEHVTVLKLQCSTGWTKWLNSHGNCTFHSNTSPSLCLQPCLPVICYPVPFHPSLLAAKLLPVLVWDDGCLPHKQHCCL